MVMDRGNYQILRFAQNDNALLRMTFLVTIDAAAGGVKDLKPTPVLCSGFHHRFSTLYC